MDYPGYLIIPEGGSHPRALEGIDRMMQEINDQISNVNYLVCPVGTGATFAGMVKSAKRGQRTIGISALKSSVFFREIQYRWGLDKYHNWSIADQWHFGGYGKMTRELDLFIRQFEINHGMLLDPLYNGKAMFATCEYLKYQLFPSGSKVVFIHTGGLQGWRGFKDH